ncbi:MAG TPA: methyltransferase domain-containing protein [Polyangiaceae bacterium]|nr:methyltransferase domain-containing protein [Polyangiaceae bacterium]
MTHEHQVQQFYDDAIHCYRKIMGNRWHHGDPDAVAAGLPRLRCCAILEERLIELTGVGPGDRVLDFGSGIGGPTCHMAKVTSASFVGVGNNERLNHAARALAQETGLAGQVSFLTLDDTGYKSLPFPDSSFDAVTFIESVCHVADRPALFRELARVLKPGGRLAGEDWIQRPFGDIRTEEQILRFMEPVNRLICIPYHGTIEGYRQHMEDAGLEVLVARDLYAGVRCWSKTQDEERPDWFEYNGPDFSRFREGEAALLAAREAGVFTIGMWVARKPPVRTTT